MRALKKNKQKIYYANYSNQVELTDANGLYTGEIGAGYTTPQSVEVNISASRGESVNDLFGTDLNYSKKIVSDKDLGFTENTILWVNKAVTDKHDYIVVGIAKSLNSVSYAIRGVDVS